SCCVFAHDNGPTKRIGFGVPCRCRYGRTMTKWEYLTAPVLVHSTKQILDNFGSEGWELVQMVPGMDPENLVAYIKRPVQEYDGNPRVSSVEARLSAMGLTVPDVVAPVAACVPTVQTGSLILTAGQLPMQDGSLIATGKVGVT